MTLPDWVNDLSLICGVGGLVLSYFAYRRSGQMKAIDLRLELRKIDADLHGLLRKLPLRLDHARSMHAAASTMPGLAQWQADWDADKQQLARMAALLPSPQFDYRGLKPVELASQLVRRHEIFSEIRILEEKYECSIAEDEQRRREQTPGPPMQPSSP